MKKTVVSQRWAVLRVSDPTVLLTHQTVAVFTANILGCFADVTPLTLEKPLPGNTTGDKHV